MNSRTDAIINEIEKVIIGKRNVVERVLMAILSEGISFWMMCREPVRPHWH